jgi:hypothetical protein
MPEMPGYYWAAFWDSQHWVIVEVDQQGMIRRHGRGGRFGPHEIHRWGERVGAPRLDRTLAPLALKGGNHA